MLIRGEILGEKNKHMKSDASEHVFHSFVLGMNNVIQWGSDAISRPLHRVDHAIDSSPYIVLPTEMGTERRGGQQSWIKFGVD